MTCEEVLAELESFGDEQTKKTFMRHGAREPFFGVKVQDLKKIQKKVKVDHELALALHMMQGTWRYFKSERQAIEEENEFRKEMAAIEDKPFEERVYVSGMPICPETDEKQDTSWNQQLICN